MDPCPQNPVAGAAADYRQIQVFNPKLPTYQVHNSCDIGGICPNALLLEKQLGDLGGSVLYRRGHVRRKHAKLAVDRGGRALDRDQ